MDHVLLNLFPQVQDLAATERPDVMDPLYEYRVLQASPYGAGIIFNPVCQFLGCQVSYILQ